MFLSYGGWEAFQASGQFPTWALALVAGLLASLAVLCASNPGHAPAWHLILLLWAVAAAVSWHLGRGHEFISRGVATRSLKFKSRKRARPS